MKVFEIRRWTSSVSDGKGPFVPDGHSGFLLSEEAEIALDELLARYGNSSWYLDDIQNNWASGPWAFVCLDKEYELAGHVVEARREGKDLSDSVGFLPLARPPNPIPSDYCPAVGILVLRSKETVETMAARSRLFAHAWVALRDLPEQQHWLAITDALDETWVEESSRDNFARWTASRS